jgi:hypothetical protein
MSTEALSLTLHSFSDGAAKVGRVHLALSLTLNSFSDGAVKVVHPLVLRVQI